MRQNKKKPVSIKEGTLFPLEQIHREPKKKAFPYRGYHPRKGSSSNNRLWMDLYPEPKRQAAQQRTETGEALRHDGE